MARGLGARERATIAANTMSVGLFRYQAGDRVPTAGRTRKKDDPHPFASLSLASVRCLVGEGVGRLRATAKRIAARRREEAEPEGSPAKSPDGRPFPLPQSWAAQMRVHTSGPLSSQGGSASKVIRPSMFDLHDIKEGHSIRELSDPFFTAIICGACAAAVASVVFWCFKLLF
jgi:hypothetical protein